MDVLTPAKIDKAYERIQSLIIKTPLISNETINKKVNANVYFKLENLKRTGSFKIRGASNKISQLSNEEKSRGVVAYSSGNHAQAVAYVSNIYNVKSTIVIPRNAPSIKIENTKKYGANIVMYDVRHNNREKITSEIASKENKTIIKPYDDLNQDGVVNQSDRIDSVKIFKISSKITCNMPCLYKTNFLEHFIKFNK